jgi:membrane protease subunit HflK
VVPKARGEGQGLLEQAEAYKTRVIKSAQGETSRFNQLLAEYQRAPEVTRERLYLDTIESVMARSPKVMVDVKGGNNLMFLPLDQLMNRASTATGALKGLSGGSSDSQTLIDEFNRNASRNRERETRQ